jgi:hypothetical protein
MTDTRPREAVDAAPYAVLLRHLHEDGASYAELGRRIGYSNTEVRHIATGQRDWIHAATARDIDKLLESLSHRVDGR